MGSKILDIASYFPEQILSNEELAELFPDWTAEKILVKTGIEQRHIAGPDETASDLAYEAASALFKKGKVKKEEVDYLIFCTQAPDYVLPTSACILQDRLGLSRSSGALDINLGCSGYVYGLSLAKALLESGVAKCVLLLTADTYSKYIHPLDKSVRTLFGDAGAATVLVNDASANACIGPFVFGTDGSGARNLIVESGGFRMPKSVVTGVEYSDESGNIRSKDNLFMDGAEIMAFSLKEVPSATNELLKKAGLDHEQIDLFVLHQANKFMLEALGKKMKIPTGKLPVLMHDCGNTVSSTIPVTLERLEAEGTLKRGMKLALVGFGVGYSWAGCIVEY